MLTFLMLADSVEFHDTCDAMIGLPSSALANSSCTDVKNMDQRTSIAQREKTQRLSSVDNRL